MDNLRDSYLGYFSSAVAVFAFAWIFILHLGWGLFDSGCPTYTLNLVRQVERGLFPATFPGVPEWPANYHQGGVYLAGNVARHLNIDPEDAIRLITFVFGFLTFASLIMLANRSRHKLLAVLVVIAGYFSASFPNDQIVPLNPSSVGWYTYISLFEYLNSFSWPIALFAITIYYIFEKKSNYLIYPLLLLLPIFNATSFAVVYIGALLRYCIGIANSSEKFSARNLVVNFSLFAVCYLLPLFYTSAYSLGEGYERVALRFSIFKDDAISFLFGYIKLYSLFALFGLWGSMLQILKGKKSLFPILCLVAFLFPFIFYVEQINNWDNMHKFVLLTNFFSVFVLLDVLNDRRSYNSTLWLGCLASLFISIPANYNFLKTRIDWSYKINSTPSQSEIISNYINSLNGRKMIWHWGENEICSPFSKIVSETGSSFAGYYSENFLISPDIEHWVKKERYWYTSENFKELIARHKMLEHLVVVPVEHAARALGFIEKSEVIVLAEERVDNYMVYSLMVPSE